MKKILLLAALSAGLHIAAMATVPVRRQVTHVQPDGTVLTLTVTGNGRFVTYATADGTAVLRGSDGHYYYAQAENGNLVCTAQPAHDAAHRTEAERRLPLLTRESAAHTLRTLYAAPQFAVGTRSTAKGVADGLGTYKQSGTGTVNSIGAPVIPVVMVNFSDRVFQDTINAAKMNRFFNEKGYSDEPFCRGSVKDYFTAQSNGLFSPTFEVVATVTVPQGYAYYGKNGENGKVDVNITQFAVDALTEAEKTVDFSKYATDGNVVPLVTLMYAGPGEQSSYEDGCEDYIWAQFKQAVFNVNGGSTKIRSFFVGNELLQSYGSGPNEITGAAMDGIGLFCHEFGHALGLPDFYNTAKRGEEAAPTMGYWSMMDYGMYFYDGYRPVGYMAYERSNLGWLDVKELTEAQYAKLYPYGRESEGPTAYVLRNPECPTEYYLLENRQRGTWYHSMMGTGMLVTHVDYDEAKWRSNTVNVGEKQCMSFLPADNKNDGTSANGSMTELFNGYKGDLFPGTQNVNSLTAETTPALTLYNGTKGVLDLPLYHISESADGVISFSFIDPDLTGITAVTTDGGQAGRAAAYTLAGRRVTDLRTAAPGIYILPGGKKFVKK